jgi:hypothetical protein
VAPCRVCGFAHSSAFASAWMAMQLSYCVPGFMLPGCCVPFALGQ